MLFKGSIAQKCQNLPRHNQIQSNANGMGLVMPWQVCLFFALSCLGEHIFILSQFVLMHRKF